MAPRSISRPINSAGSICGISCGHVAGVAWIAYWFSKRGLIGRFVAVASGQAEDLIITPQERIVGAVSLAAVLGTVIIFYAITASQLSEYNSAAGR